MKRGVLRFAVPAVFLLFADLPGQIADAHHCPGEPERPAKPNHSCRTRTQTIHTGEPGTTHPGGNPGRRGESRPEDCIAPIDPEMVEKIQSERNEVLRALAGGGYATERTLVAMNKLIAARLQHMTDPNEGILVRTSRAAGEAAVNAPQEVVKAAKAVAAYLANDNAANHRHLYQQAQAAMKSAEQALKDQLRNPHVTLATVADEVLVGKATGMAGNMCRAGAAKAIDLTREFNEARKAKQTLGRMSENSKEFTDFQRSLQKETGNSPPRSGGQTPSGPIPNNSGIPGTCWKNQCWPNVQAVDNYWKTGKWIEPKMRGIPNIDELEDLPSLDPFHVKRDLTANFGGSRALDPRHGPGGQQSHAKGDAVPSSRQQIEDTIQDGDQGYVFIDWEQTVAGEKITGQHVVNVRKQPNQPVEFFDRGTLNDSSLRGQIEPHIWNNARRVRYFRTK